MMTGFEWKRPLRLYRFWAEQRGAAAVEFALVLSLLAIPILNVVDFSLYAWDRMQVDNAAQGAAQAAWATCDVYTKLPATTNCSSLNTATTTAAQSTVLGNAITVTSRTENYYCIKAGVLYTQGTFPGNKPSDCGSWGGSSSDQPGDYIKIAVSYTYSPLFPGVSIVGYLPTPVVRTAWMRLG